MGSEFGRVRALRSAAGQAMEEVLPGIPVEVSGLRGMPQAGDDFLVQARWVIVFLAKTREDKVTDKPSHAVCVRAH